MRRRSVVVRPSGGGSRSGALASWCVLRRLRERNLIIMRQHATLLGLVLALLLPGELHALDDAMRWRTAFLDKSGEMYWWRPGFDSNDPEVAFTEPDDIWKYGQTEAGSPYIWRTDPRGKPEVQMWRSRGVGVDVVERIGQGAYGGADMVGRCGGADVAR